MEKRFTLSVFTEHNPGVLQRITIMFTRRKINIETLTVSETERKGIARFTLVIFCDEHLVRVIARQMRRIVEVLHVNVFEDEELHHKELAFVRVEVKDEKAREDITALAQSYGAHATPGTDGNLILELTAAEQVTDKLCNDLSKYRIIEFVRSGRVAIPKVGALHEEAVKRAI